MNSSPVVIQKHQPERRRKAVTTVYCGCSCCCCCCCLHTVGSLVGAAVAPTFGSGGIGLGAFTTLPYYHDEDTGRTVPLFRKAGLSSVSVFWWLLCAMIFACLALAIVTNEGRTDAVVITGIGILMVFPVLQLASALLTAIVFACWPRFDKGHQLKQLGRITLGVIIGTLSGIGVMAALGAAFTLMRH